jgi:hypothetical protein
LASIFPPYNLTLKSDEENNYNKKRTIFYDIIVRFSIFALNTCNMITPSKLRENLYNLLDQVIQTGKPIEVKRKNKILKIIVEPSKSKLDNLKKRDILNCKPDEIINNNWEKEWKA